MTRDHEPGHIVITKRDVLGEELVCVDLDSGIWFRYGFPRNRDGIVDAKVMKELSGPPYVFDADVLTLVDDEHPGGVRLEHRRVIFMHGGRKVGGRWMFSSLEEGRGQPVVETVERLNEYFVARGEPKIEVVAACNKYPPREGDLGIRVGEFGGEIVHAVGERAYLQCGQMDEDGRVTFGISTDRFWGLNEMEIRNQIRFLD